MRSLLYEKLIEVLQAVAPLILAVVVLQFTVVHAPNALFLQFLAGSVLSIAGMLLLFVGIDLGVIPIGRYIGAELPRRGSLVLILTVAFSIGFVTTIPEPDVLVLSTQVDQASGGRISGESVMYLIALGVGLLTAAGMARVVFGWSMRMLLTASYLFVLLLVMLSASQYIPLSFDAGSVTTGVLSAPVIIALAIGISSVLAGRSAVHDGFGLVGLASIGPIIVMLLLGWWRA